MSILQTVLSAVLLYFVARIQLHKLRSFVPRSYPYPPSPPASWIPLVGHALQIPQQSQWKTFRKWSEQYGDVVRISVMGQQMIILDSFEAAWELLSIRGNIYSDRPKAVMAGELYDPTGWDRGLGYAQGPPSLRFKLLRKLFNQYMGPAVYRSSPASKPDILRTQEKATKILLKRLLESPEEYARITNECSSYLFLLTIYGWDASNTLHREIIKDKGDLVDIVNIAMEGFAKASEPGAFWVDNWSIMRYIPSWFPFATFKSTAKQMRIDLDRLYDVPWGFVKGEVDRGTALPSFVRSYLTSRSEWNHNHSLANNEDSPDDEIVRAAGASIYSGMTPSSIQSFILAMLLYSDIQKRAQSELDRYFNSLDMNLRLPESSDRPSLPYVSAIVKEVWRWGCAVPLGLAHVVTQDDVYREMHIDQGSVVWANIWSMLNNPSVFPSPEKFDPSRFLEVTESGGLAMRQLDKKEDPSEIAFGFGRRVCPGLHLAEHSLFLTIASILYTFDILPHDSEPGIPEWVGFISFPKQFCCRIVPRSEAKRDLVESLSKGPNC